MKCANKAQRLGDISQIILGAIKSAYSSEPGAEAEKTYLLRGVNLDAEGGIDIEDVEPVSLSSALRGFFLNDSVVIIEDSRGREKTRRLTPTGRQLSPANSDRLS